MGLQLSQRSPILFNMKACISLLALAVAVQAQKFEPVTCDYEKGEMMCPGKWNEDWTEQLTADFCIPMKVGDCYNHCPMECGKDMMICPGMTHADGYKDPDFCNYGKFCPVHCDYDKEMMCPGTWDAKTGEQTSADFCVPHKNGECAAHCPQTCQDGDMMSPGMTHADGCKDADYCISGKFCTANCDWEKEKMCAGKWNEDWTEQISGDYCIPQKTGDCYNHCPVDCGKDMVCPGGMDANGCPTGDMCYPADTGCPKM